MLKPILFIQFLIIETILLSGCGSSSDDSSSKIETNTTLRASESLNCVETKDLRLTPSEEKPDITLVKDVTSDEITISVDSNSVGYVIVSNCK